jgi:hypothetical protein
VGLVQESLMQRRWCGLRAEEKRENKRREYERREDV